jgi:hypothetical protein
MTGLMSGTQGALTINTSDLADDAVSLAKMAPGTDGQIITYDASGNPSVVGPGTDGQVLTSTGAGSPPAFEALSAGYTMGTDVQLGSGAVDYTGIPSGTKIVRLVFEEMSVQGTGLPQLSITIGDSGGLETSGYVSLGVIHNTTGGSVASTSAFVTEMTQHQDIFSGFYDLTLLDATNHTYIFSGLGKSSADDFAMAGGSKTLSGELTQIRITPSGNVFDNGSMNILFI